MTFTGDLVLVLGHCDKIVEQWGSMQSPVGPQLVFVDKVLLEHNYSSFPMVASAVTSRADQMQAKLSGPKIPK